MKKVVTITIFALMSAASVRAADWPIPANATDIAPKTTVATESGAITISGAPLANAAVNPEPPVPTELAIKTKAVSDALNLSIAEVNNLRSGLSGLPDFKDRSDATILKGNYMATLDAYAGYYAGKLAALSAIQTLDGVKSLAQEIISFRNGAYGQSVAAIADYLLFFYTENALATANDRLGKLTSDIQRLKSLNVINPSLGKDKLAATAEILKEAGSYYAKASAVVLSAGQPAVASADQNPPADETAPTETGSRELMMNSLTNIKLAYELFIQIAKDIRKSAKL